MSVPGVTMREVDGGLGVLPASSGNLQAYIGDAQSGPLNEPAAYGDSDAVKAVFGVSGPLVEGVCYAIEHFGAPVVVTRATRAVDGTTADLDISGVAGTCTPAIDASVKPTDDGEIVIKITLGGVVGTGPITYQWSRDGGRTFSVDTSLGAAVFILVPNSGVKWLLDAASTLVTGDTFSVTAKAPNWDSTALSAAIDALGASKLNWEYGTILGEATGTILDAVETKRTGLVAKGKHRWFQVHFRMPNVGESDGAYQTAFAASFSSHRSTGVEVYSGAAKTLSANSTLVAQYRRSPIYSVAPVYASAEEHQDIAKIEHGPLVGVQIRDENGNLDEHDELEEPGLDGLASTCLRTWDSRDGVFVNNPRLHSPVGSDFQFVQHRRVMNLARTALKAYLETRLSDDIVVDAKTGFLLKSEADDIDSGANAALAAVLDAGPKASPSSPDKPRFAVSRTDNLLASNVVHYKCRIIPLGYIKALDGDIGFNNPASRVVTG